MNNPSGSREETGPLIGITGPIGAGKSTVCSILESLGAAIIYADQLAHQTYLPDNPCFQRILSSFGRQILTRDALIDRKKLGALVFPDPEKMKHLCSIVWPETLRLIHHQVQNIRENDPRQAIALEAAVLTEAGWHKDTTEVWLITAPPMIRLQRIMQRNKLTEAEAAQRIHCQNFADQNDEIYDLILNNTNNCQEIRNSVELNFLRISSGKQNIP